jgi:hypothetical protein
MIVDDNLYCFWVLFNKIRNLCFFRKKKSRFINTCFHLKRVYYPTILVVSAFQWVLRLKKRFFMVNSISDYSEMLITNFIFNLKLFTF